jgi:iduronate 2-sulfatase
VYTNCSDGTVECFPDFKTLAKAKEFLGKAADQRKSTGQPFWMMVGFVRPHVPHVFPKKYFDQVPARDDIDLAPNSNFTEGGLPVSWLKEGPAKGIDIPTDPTSARSFKRGYYAAAAFSDDLLGQLLDEVDKLGLKDDTAVILSSDHGWGLGEHNHWLKYTNFETDAMVPVFIRAPWKTSSQGKRSAALVETIDFYPTLVELAGIPLDKNESVDGTSFAHLLDNPDAEHKDAAFSQYPRCWDESVGHTYDKPMARCAGVDRTKFALMGYSMRTDGWRYTEWVEWDGSKLQANWNKLVGVELYDHSKIATNNTKERFEQTENSNLAASADKATLQRLSKQLRDFFSADGPATEFVSFTV